MSKAFVDIGHGFTDPGAVDGLNVAAGDFLTTKESILNLHVGLYLDDALRRHGIQTMLSREDDKYYPTLEERCSMANSWGADLFVAVHFNSYGTDGPRGIEVWSYKSGTTGATLATNIYNAAAPLTPWTDRGVKYSTTYAVLNGTNMPAVIVEGGFITNTDEEILVNTDGYQFSLAEAICKGVCQTLGIIYKAPAPRTNFDMFMELRLAKKRIDALTKDVAALQASIQVEQTKASQLLVENAGLKGEITTLQADLNSELADKAVLEGMIADLTAKIDSIKAIVG